MAPRGPKPKPTALKLVEGNRGKRHLKTNPVKAKGELPSCPTWLNAVGKAEWKRVSEAMPKGHLKAVDFAVLAIYCERWSDFVAAIAKKRKSGGVLVKGYRGSNVKNPAVQIARDAANDCARLAAELGFTPSSRSRMELPEIDDSDAAGIMRPSRVRGAPARR